MDFRKTMEMFSIKQLLYVVVRTYRVHNINIECYSRQCRILSSKQAGQGCFGIESGHATLRNIYSGLL